METIHKVVPSQWGHEVTTGHRLVPPTPEELIQASDEFGRPATTDDGAPVMIPGPMWERKIEEAELDTVVMFDEQSSTVFKFLFTNDALAGFLAGYIQHLNADGRQMLYLALKETSDVAIPQVDTSKLRVIKGGK